MKPIAAIILGITSIAALVQAVPALSPTKADLTRRSDVVAIVTVTDVTNRVSAERFWKRGRRQSALAVLDRTLKGTAPPTLRLTFERPPPRRACEPDSLFTGQFLVFLRREGDHYVRTDTWYGQATIVTNHVRFTLENPVPLETVVREIERTVGNQ